jgi:hypothetical protein
MISRSFKKNNLNTISEALDIAEDRTGNFYKFSLGQWKRHRYDIKTQVTMSDDEKTEYAFALLNKCPGTVSRSNLKALKQDFYFICLQDNQILKAVKRDDNINLLPLLVYIFTHELIHIVRFCNFFQRFEISGRGKEEEEKIVHATTYDILKSLSLPRLDYVLESYQDHRICDLAVT